MKAGELVPFVRKAHAMEEHPPYCPKCGTAFAEDGSCSVYCRTAAESNARTEDYLDRVDMRGSPPPPFPKPMGPFPCEICGALSEEHYCSTACKMVQIELWEEKPYEQVAQEQQERTERRDCPSCTFPFSVKPGSSPDTICDLCIRAVKRAEKKSHCILM